MIKIIIADDHAIVRRGLKQILSDTYDIKVVDEATSGEELLSKIRDKDYDIVVLDISLPGQSGLDTLKQLKVEYPDLSVLILSMYAEEQYAVRALKAGASGYLTKESAPDELIKAIRKIYGHGKYISAALAESLIFELHQDIKAPRHKALSDREYEVLCLIGAGKTVTEIADKLCLSVKTVSTYRTRIIEKMNMKNNAELIRYTIKTKLVD